MTVDEEVMTLEKQKATASKKEGGEEENGYLVWL